MDLLNRLLKWIKTHKKRFAAYVALGFIVPIVSVQVAYLIPSFIPSFSSPLSAGDLLGYYAAFIATAGTVFLGVVALWQNSVIHQKNVAIQEKIDKERKAAAKPYLKGLEGKFSHGTLVMEIPIKNESNNLAKILKVYGAGIKDNSMEFNGPSISEEVPLAPQSEFSAIFIRSRNVDYVFAEFEIFQFSIEYSDVYGDIYSKTFFYSCNVPKLIYLLSLDDFSDSNE